MRWHINCLELLAVRLALSRLRGCLQRKDVLVRTDNTATVVYINRQGGLRSRRMSQLAHHLHLWSQKHLRSLRAIHIPGVFNRAADELSRAALPGEWRLHPQVVQLIWGRFGAAQVELFASPETTHCQEFYSLTETMLGTDALAHSWPPGPAQICVPPSEPTSTDTVQDQGGRGAGLVSGLGSTHYRFSMYTIHKTGLCSEVKPVRQMVFLPPGGLLEMFDQSCAFRLRKPYS